MNEDIDEELDLDFDDDLDEEFDEDNLNNWIILFLKNIIIKNPFILFLINEWNFW